MNVYRTVEQSLSFRAGVLIFAACLVCTAGCGSSSRSAGPQQEVAGAQDDASVAEPGYDEVSFEQRRDALIIRELQDRDVDARASARGVVVTLPDVLFEFGSDQLKGPALRRIADVAEVANDRARGRRIAVEGHTDSIGAALYNQGLSERRARSVADALIEEGVAASLVSTQGYGSMFPIEPNTNDDGSDNPSGRARNRRVEIVILD